jgi:hypothetical protein
MSKEGNKSSIQKNSYTAVFFKLRLALPVSIRLGSKLYQLKSPLTYCTEVVITTIKIIVKVWIPVNYTRKEFYCIGSRDGILKTFFLHNLQMGSKSLSVCHRQAFLA